MDQGEYREKIVTLLEEILKWTRFGGMQKVKEILISALDNDTKKLIYQLSDGKSSPQIAKIAKVDPMTVRNYWKVWASMNIVEIHPDYKRRYRRNFSLDKLGIEYPRNSFEEEKIGITEEE